MLFGILDDLPKELSALYQHILDNRSERNRRKAYQTLLLLCLRTSPEYCIDFSVFQCILNRLRSFQTRYHMEQL